MALANLWATVKEMVGNLGAIAIAFVAIIVIIILFILIRIEKKLGRRIKMMEGDKNVLFISRIRSINKSDPQEVLEDINRIAIEFFRERFKVKSSVEYSELDVFFRSQNNKKAAEFCRVMNNLLYSTKETDPEINQRLMLRLINIIEDNPIIIKEEPDKPEESKQNK